MVSQNYKGNNQPTLRFNVLLIGLLATILIMACYATATSPTMVNLESVSTRASLKLVPVAKLESLSTDSSRINGGSTHRIELRTHLGRGFSLDIETEDEETFMGAEYEEIIHDVSRQTNPHEPHLTVISRKETADPVHRCLYHGRVNGDPKSVVSINTCSGSITGMIHLSNGELFSIEPVERVHKDTAARNTQTNAPIRSLSLSALRELALQGDLTSLADNNSEVVLVDVNAETKLVDDAEGRNKHLNGDDIGALSESGNDGNHFPSCASDAEKHHPPTHILRKLGYSESEIESMIRNPELNQTSDPINVLQSDDKSDEGEDNLPVRYVEVVMYHDYARLRRFNTTEGLTQRELIEAARADGIEIFNNIRSYYLNAGFKHRVKMVLMGHVYFSGGDPYLKYLSYDRKIMVISNRGLLENFNRYRSSYGHTNHDIGMLLSGNTFQANIMGVANVGSLCGGARWNGAINSITYRNIVKSSVLSAHENGHVLNSQHDARPGYIMNPYVSEDIGFSPQSLRSIDGHLRRTSCTLNKPRTASAIDNGHNVQYSREVGVLSTANADSTHNDGDFKSVATTSFIYTDNIHAGDRFDYVDSKLVSDGWFTKAEFSLPSDEVVIHTNPINTPETKSGLSTLSIVLIALGSAGLACTLTTMAILFVLRRLLHDKSTHDFFATKQITDNADIGTTQPPPQLPAQQSTPITQFTPQAKTRNFAVDLSPNTPRITPASPSYSETVRMRRTSLPRISPIDDVDASEEHK
jgi:hypothetical protein